MTEAKPEVEEEPGAEAEVETEEPEASADSETEEESETTLANPAKTDWPLRRHERWRQLTLSSSSWAR